MFRKTTKQNSEKFSKEILSLGDKYNTLVLCYLIMTKGGRINDPNIALAFMTKKREINDLGKIIDEIPLDKKHEYLNEFKRLLNLQ